MEIILANPRGFCAGVSRAINIVENVLTQEADPVYIRHEVVHNFAVVRDLKSKGAIFVKELSQVPNGGSCIFSAHGVSQLVREEASHKQLKVYDATCPLVTKVHKEVQHASRSGKECILIGHKGHPEVEGTLGQYKNFDRGIYLVQNLNDIKNLRVQDPTRLMLVTQTTLSVDETKDIIFAIQKKYPKVDLPKKEDICYATQNRQNAVKELTEIIDVLLVVGSKSSSNSNRLYELGKNKGVSSYLVDSERDLDLEWFNNEMSVGIAAGASAPEYLVQGIVEFLRESFDVLHIKNFKGIKENVAFPLPKFLKESGLPFKEKMKKSVSVSKLKS